jgi:hypothetical protein
VLRKWLLKKETFSVQDADGASRRAWIVWLQIWALFPVVHKELCGSFGMRMRSRPTRSADNLMVGAAGGVGGAAGWFQAWLCIGGTQRLDRGC